MPSRPRRDRLSVLVAHPWWERGGSEATTLWALHALQEERCELFLVTCCGGEALDWERLNAAYGTAVDPDRVRMIRAPGPWPGGAVLSMGRASDRRRRRFERFCRRIAPRFDLCLGSNNPVDFGRPGVQLVVDFTFEARMRRRLMRRSDYAAAKWRGTVPRARGRRWVSGSGNRPFLPRRGDLVIANSRWTVQQLARHFGLPEEGPVLYPPVVLPEVVPGAERDPLGFACLGRISPEKEVGRIIAILAEVRERGFPVTLELFGPCGEDSYGRSVAALVERHRDWIRPHGFLDLETKRALLTRQSWALHACRVEAFGIAVAELVSLGCLPFVPDSGGAPEIVPHAELQFGSAGEAVEKIVALLENPGRGEELRGDLRRSVERFGPEAFAEGLREQVRGFMHRGRMAGQGPLSPAPGR